LIWSFVILALRFVQGERMPVSEWLTTLLLGRTNDAYYFVPVLIQLYLLAPFIVPLARRNWKWTLAIAGFVQLVILTMRYYQTLGYIPEMFTPILFLARSWFFPGLIFWFTLEL
jgi:hypothetical protein